MISLGSGTDTPAARPWLAPRAALLLLALFAAAPWPTAAAPDLAVRCEGDVTDALQAAMDAGARAGATVILAAPGPGAACRLSHGLTVPGGLRLVGAGQPVLALTRSGRAFTGGPQSGGFLIAGLTLDGTDTPSASIVLLRGTPSGQMRDLRLLRPGDGIALVEGTHDVTISGLVAVDSRQHGVTIADSHDNVVEDAQLDGQRGFGVIVTGTSYGNRLDRLRTARSGLELVGMTWRTHHNTLTNSVAARTGDNCFSVTGSHNRLENLSGSYCAGNGITLYGSYNVLEGGRFVGNSQQHTVRPAWSAGVQFAQGFGGVAQHNTVRNVVVDDDQAQPTQQVGVMTDPRVYVPWAPRSRVALGDYRYAGSKLYRAASAGMTGDDPPAGEGTARDGGVTWTYVNAFAESPLPDYNRAEAIEVRRVVRAAREDRSPAQHNAGTR